MRNLTADSMLHHSQRNVRRRISKKRKTVMKMSMMMKKKRKKKARKRVRIYIVVFTDFLLKSEPVLLPIHH